MWQLVIWLPPDQEILIKEKTKSHFQFFFVRARGISILGEVRNMEISRVTQQLQCSKSHDFLDIFALAHSKINQIA